MRCDSESTFFSGAGHSPPCPELTPLSFLGPVFPWKQLSNCLWSCCPHIFLRNQPWELLGSWLTVPLPWAQKGSAATCWPPVAWGDNISDPAFAPWVTVAGMPGFALPNKASRASKLQNDSSNFLFSPHKVINERISAVNSLGCFIIYLYFFTIHLSITQNFHWHQQDLQYLFFCLII